VTSQRDARRANARHVTPSSIGTGLAMASCRRDFHAAPIPRKADDMLAWTVKRTVSRWRPMALGAAVGYVTLLLVTRWAETRSRKLFGVERNGFHPHLFV